MKWFMYDPGSHDDLFTLFDTEAEARRAAEMALDKCEEISADDGWPEDTGGICWGKLCGQAVVVERIPWADHLRAEGQEVEEDDQYFDEYVSYKLREPS